MICIVDYEHYTQADINAKVNIAELPLVIQSKRVVHTLFYLKKIFSKTLIFLRFSAYPDNEYFTPVQDNLVLGKPAEIGITFKSNPEPTYYRWNLPGGGVIQQNYSTQARSTASTPTAELRNIVSRALVHAHRIKEQETRRVWFFQDNTTFTAVLKFDKLRKEDVDTYVMTTGNIYGDSNYTIAVAQPKSGAYPTYKDRRLI